MKLRYSKVNIEYELNLGEIAFLTIENPDLFDDIFSDIIAKINGGNEHISIIDDDKETDFNKQVSVICSPSDITLDTTNIKKKLYQEMSISTQDDELSQRFADLYQSAITLIEEIAIKTNLDIEMNADFDVKDLFSALKITARESVGNFAERLINYFKVVNTLLGKHFYMVINCDGFLNPSEYDEISKEAAYKDISILFVNCRQVMWASEKKEYIIDKDLCEL